MIIYKITNRINGKIYIGQTVRSLEQRKREHLQSAERGVNRHLYDAIRKYGAENFDFEELCSAESKVDLNYLEAKYIVEYDSVRNGYNMGYGGDNDVMFSLCVKEKHDAIMRSVSVREKISKSLSQYRKENPFTPEHRAKISEKAKGNKHGVGRHLSDTHKEALNRSHFKRVYCIDHNGQMIQRFETVQSAAKWWFDSGYNTVNDWKQLSNQIKKSNTKDIYIKGLKWIYEEGGDASGKVN